MWAYVYVLNTKQLLYVPVTELLNFSSNDEDSYEKKFFFGKTKPIKFQCTFY